MSPFPNLRRFTLRSKIREEKGSAALEFVALALPLFIPIFIYLQQFGALSSGEEIARILARESVRAFVASDNDLQAYAIAEKVVRVGGSKLGFAPDQIGKSELRITCRSLPCISPNNLVIATVTISGVSTGRRVSASAQEYVSAWQ